MKVFKFGGASLKDADAIRNTARIIRIHADQKLLVVVSAMGKTTDALERVMLLSRNSKDHNQELSSLIAYHDTILRTLFTEGHPVFQDVKKIFQDVESALQLSFEYDMVYDQVISNGEIISSIIMHHLLVQEDLNAAWIDARNYIFTDQSYREGKVDWEASCRKIQELKAEVNKSIIVTQGFIGSSAGMTVTLGREGSDFSAAIFASCLPAESVTIWKDVPGVMSADPKLLSGAVVFAELPFKEAAEMTYYGASVIHPKTIKPLANKNIPLYVKNFVDPSLPGTVIHDCQIKHLPPLVVFKGNQCLISCKVTDYTFVNEQQLSTIFNALSSLDIRINVMQNSAISFSFCIDFRESKISSLIQKLQQHFEVYYNVGLTLITIKNYDQETFEKYRKLKGVLMEQSSRSTLQVLVRNQA